MKPEVEFPSFLPYFLTRCAQTVMGCTQYVVTGCHLVDYMIQKVTFKRCLYMRKKRNVEKQKHLVTQRLGPLIIVSGSRFFLFCVFTVEAHH